VNEDPKRLIGAGALQRGDAPAMLSVSSIAFDTFSSICPGMMPKSLRWMVKVERMTSRSPF
jgi:hypothetical protein